MPIPELLTINEFTQWARIGRTRTYEEIGRGALRALKIGRRTLITRDDALAWLAGQPTFEPRSAQ
jgi:excisionase family DNA binding protein